MDFLREMVGGPKNRYKQNGYNLDLSYITPRIIAMAFPATGIQKLYRNSAEAVSNFLKFKHKNRYITINLSNRAVEENVLKNVYSYEWEDHKPLSFQKLFEICYTMAKFLEKDPEAVATIHCNHGKGRTGALISCFLLFSGVFESSGEVMKYYSDKRFEKEGHGVTQPGQIAYIKYFNIILKNPKLKPQVVFIRRIVFQGGRHLTDPYLKLKNITTKDELFSTKKNNSVLLSDSDNKLNWKFSQEILFAGDFMIEIKQDSKIGKNYVGGYHFNTTFVPLNNCLEVNLNELSPHSLNSSGLFDLDFKMEIHFRTACNCDKMIALEQRCVKCKEKLVGQDAKVRTIQKVLKSREKFVTIGRQLLFGKVSEEEFLKTQKCN